MNHVYRSLPIALFATLLIALALTSTHVAATSTPYARGKELFATKGCAHCHGTEGINGDRAPDLQQVRNRLSAAQLSTQISAGSKGMPAFGDDLTTPEINDLVAYLRTKRKTIIKPPPNPPTPPSHKPDPD